MKEIVRLYLGEVDFHNQTEISLDAQISHRLMKVMRMSNGDMLHAFNHSGEFLASLLYKKKNVVILKIIEEVKDFALHTSFPKIHLAQALSKGEKMDYIVQKSTELGVESIQPIISDFVSTSYNKSSSENKLRRWQAIAISATEQSRRVIPPSIKHIINIDDFLASDNSEIKIILHPYSNGYMTDNPDKKLRHLLDDIFLPVKKNKKLENITVVIGSEGGFSNEEVSFASTQGFIPVTLGGHILRTETAPVVMLSILNFYLNKV